MFQKRATIVDYADTSMEAIRQQTEAVWNIQVSTAGTSRKSRTVFCLPWLRSCSFVRARPAAENQKNGMNGGTGDLERGDEYFAGAEELLDWLVRLWDHSNWLGASVFFDMRLSPM